MSGESQKPNTKAIALMATAAILFSGFVLPPAPAHAADTQYLPNVSRALAFARSDRAQSVWASGVCWSECGSVTTWNLAACLERDGQGHCLKRADSADGSCQRECRSSGGPLLPIDF
jgi:hypothetical protein